MISKSSPCEKQIPHTNSPCIQKTNIKTIHNQSGTCMILPNHEIISFLQEVRRSFEFGKGALGIPFGPIWPSGTQNNQSVQVEISNSNWTVLIVLRQRQKQFSQYFAQYVIKHRQSMLELYTTLVHLYFQSHKLFRPEIQNQLFSHSIRVSF